MSKSLQYYESLIIKLPTSMSWHNPFGNFKDGIHELPELTEGLCFEDTVLALIASYNKIDKAIGYKTLIKITKETRSKIKEIIDKYRKEGLIYWHTLLDEDTGLLTGKGLVFNEIFD